MTRASGIALLALLAGCTTTADDTESQAPEWEPTPFPTSVDTVRGVAVSEEVRVSSFTVW